MRLMVGVGKGKVFIFLDRLLSLTKDFIKVPKNTHRSPTSIHRAVIMLPIVFGC